MSRRPVCASLAAALAVALILAAPVSRAASAPAGLDCAETRIHALTEVGPVSFEIEIADEPEEQSRGLMFRQSLAADAGMLFVFDAIRPAAFWMKNTLIPLDMIFIDDTGRVTGIAAQTVPHSLEVRRSDGPVRAVLEINGGRAAELGIVPGTQMVHRAFGAAPEAHRCGAD